MDFVEDLEALEEMFEQHKIDNHDIQDFRQNVDECIARQVGVDLPSFSLALTALTLVSFRPK